MADDGPDLGLGQLAAQKALHLERLRMGAADEAPGTSPPPSEGLGGSGGRLDRRQCGEVPESRRESPGTSFGWHPSPPRQRSQGELPSNVPAARY